MLPAHEPMELEGFPTGWPVRCPGCRSWGFTYKSDRTGNLRAYLCRICQEKYLAWWKGEPMSSCLAEPKNTKMEDWEWARVVERPCIEAEDLSEGDIIDVEAFEVVDVPELVDGTPARQETVVRLT